MAIKINSTQEISVGDIVKLNEPYPNEKGYEFGIIVEILDDLRISLHLYNRSGQLYALTNNIPTYVDTHISEITLYKRAKTIGYQEERQPVLS